MNFNFFDLSLPYNCIHNSIIQSVIGCVNEEMEVEGWILMVLSNNIHVVLKFKNGEFKDEGFMLDDKSVLKVIGNIKSDGLIYDEESIEEGIVDLDHGTRFEGNVLKESGIPFGFGEMYDDDGLLAYKGIMINWKRFGYGVSYHNNGWVEYEGYWCDDKRCGRGKLYDRGGQLVKECEWWNGSECGTEYIGDGSQPINIAINCLILKDECILKDWNVSQLYNLESIEIGDDCFDSVTTFKIDGLSRLKTLKIGSNSFTAEKYWFGNDETKSFLITNCEFLQSIEIGEYSFSDFAGPFELKNLNSLTSIKIGIIGNWSYNFYYASFVAQSINMIFENS